MAAPKIEPLPFRYQLLAGGVAGTTEILLMYPLDVVKTRLQIATRQAGTKVGLLGQLRAIVANEGFGALYRGIIPPIMMEAPKRALKFSTNDQYGTALKPYFVHQNKYLLGFCTGILAGATESVLVVPFDLVKINLQDPSKKAQYKGTLDCVKQLYLANVQRGGLMYGVLGFYRGAESTLWRHAVWSGTYFGLIGYLKDRQITQQLKQSSNSQLVDFTVGTIAATVSTLFNTPYDVAKSRIQAGTGKIKWVHSVMLDIVRQEGITALWKGFVPKVVRLGPGGGVMLVVYGTICDFIRREWMPKN